METMETTSLRDKARPLVLAARRSALAWKVIGGPVRRVLGRLPHLRGFYTVADDFHPFDLAHGSDTSGCVLPSDLPRSEFTSEVTFSYGGVHPKILRETLAVLPETKSFTFIDLGCGKGRALLVASEFPFRAILGADISPKLIATARANARLFARRFPGRTPIQAEVIDAGRFQFPSGDIVLFLYNPFGTDIMKRVVAALELALDQEPARRVFIVYENPVYGSCWDASPRFSRYFAATLDKAADERGRHRTEVVVIWQAGHELIAHPGSEARIVPYESANRAELEE